MSVVSGHFGKDPKKTKNQNVNFFQIGVALPPLKCKLLKKKIQKVFWCPKTYSAPLITYQNTFLCFEAYLPVYGLFKNVNFWVDPAPPLFWKKNYILNLLDLFLTDAF